MKSIIVFYEDTACAGSGYGDSFAGEKVFGGKSAEDLSGEWAACVSEDCSENCSKDVVYITSDEAETVCALLAKMKEAADIHKADYVVFSWRDLPFLNKELTKQLIEAHENYSAEYTFADGYPYGLSPELIDAGTLGILVELSKSVQKEMGQKKVCRESIFNLLKTDINSFEVETVLSPEDFRLYRFHFDCSKKENFIACKALYESVEKQENCRLEQAGAVAELDSVKISQLASKNPGVLKTVPGFYNIQIAESCAGKCIYCPYPAACAEKNGTLPEKCNGLMDYTQFSSLVDKIAVFSEDAVIGLSAWGEPFKHPELLKMIEKVLSYEGLSVFLETDGSAVDEVFCSRLAEITENAAERKNGWQKVMIAVSVDAFTAETYKKMHGKDVNMMELAKVVSCLNKAVPGCIYPQFVRTNHNEEELESFFRYWNEKSNVSAGNLIIQKYDDFAKLLPECKPADLSPIERNVCWHLRRDMTVLANGDVPFCREYVLSGIIGNVFNEGLEEIWKKTDSALIEQMNCKYNEKCRDCDEYYTFNF